MDSKEFSKTRLASMGATGARRVRVGGDDVATPGTLSGKRKRAPAGGAMDSDTSTQSRSTKFREGGLRAAFGEDKEAAPEHAQ